VLILFIKFLLIRRKNMANKGDEVLNKIMQDVQEEVNEISSDKRIK